ncbi:MAG: hypothetical protein WAU17_12835, partial [Nitrospirales bacterium]
TRSHLLIAGIGAILQYCLIVGFGLQGAAAATLLAEMLLIVLLGSQLKALFVWQSIGRRIGICTLAVIVFLVPLGMWNHLAMPVTILFSVLIYGGVLGIFKDIRQNELTLILNYLAYNRGIPSAVSQKPITKTGQT